MEPAEQANQRLPLVVLEQKASLIRLQVQLNGDFSPFNIRKPVWIQLTSKKAPDLSITPPSKRIFLSSWWFCFAISTLFVAIVYALLAIAVYTFYAPGRASTFNWKRQIPKILDPAVLSASDYGAASMANLQILWFSMIVTWIMANAWLVTGQLLNMSPQLLGLLGISGGVKVVASSLTSGQQRISLDNWNWLVDQQLLRPENEIDPTLVAKWRDFVIDGGVLNPSRYQLMIFGFLTGLKLLFGEIGSMQSFEVPNFFLELQGVSSAIYLFGKAVSPNTKEELEKYINTLRENETTSLSPKDMNYLYRGIASLYGPAALGPKAKLHPISNQPPNSISPTEAAGAGVSPTSP
jgi:hypothetical protein